MRMMLIITCCAAEFTIVCDFNRCMIIWCFWLFQVITSQLWKQCFNYNQHSLVNIDPKLLLLGLTPSAHPDLWPPRDANTSQLFFPRIESRIGRHLWVWMSTPNRFHCLRGCRKTDHHYSWIVFGRDICARQILCASTTAILTLRYEFCFPARITSILHWYPGMHSEVK